MKKSNKKMSLASNPYGDGKASARIVDILKKNLYGEEIENVI